TVPNFHFPKASLARGQRFSRVWNINGLVADDAAGVPQIPDSSIELFCSGGDEVSIPGGSGRYSVTSPTGASFARADEIEIPKHSRIATRRAAFLDPIVNRKS